MGTILSSRKTSDGKIVFEVQVEYDEALQLRGHWNQVYLFTEQIQGFGAQISGRGKNEATKYFLIPRELRKGFDLRAHTPVACQKMDTPTRTMFIYIVDKLG